MKYFHLIRNWNACYSLFNRHFVILVSFLLCFNLTNAQAQYNPMDDADGDFLDNWYDIDDDDDGIPDVLEQGMATTGFVNTSDVSFDIEDTDDGNIKSFDIYDAKFKSGGNVYPDAYSLSPSIPNTIVAGELLVSKLTGNPKDYTTAGNWANEGKKAFKDRKLHYYHERNNNTVSADSYFQLDYSGLTSAPDKYIVFTDISGDNSVTVKAYDANDNLLSPTNGALLVGANPLEWIDTDIESPYAGQNVFLTIYPLTDLASWGSEIAYLRIYWNDVSGMDGKVLIVQSDDIEDEMPDQDGDGIPNNLDLDSDNDALADILEVGGVDQDNDGREDSDVDTDGDGLCDYYDIAPNSNASTTRLPLYDTDGDGIFGYLDLDSDNDGISDIFEVDGVDLNGDGWVDDYDEDNPTAFDMPDRNGYSNTYEGNVVLVLITDVNNDGLPDSYDSKDADGDGTPDAVETDSDDDGCSDVLESGLSALFPVPDADGNGIFGQAGGNEIYDNNGFFDQNKNGWHDDIETLTFAYLDFDNDGTPDFRDATIATACNTTVDYGDAPIADDVAHEIVDYDANTRTAPLMLGVLVDADLTVATDINATEDDDNLTDDEDALGIFPILTTIMDSYTLWVDVTNVTGADAYLGAWIDLDQDGAFDASEAASATVGNNEDRVKLTWNNLSNFAVGTTYLRLRISLDPTDTLSATGVAESGEVEDYLFEVLRTEECPSEAFLVQGGSTWYATDLSTGDSEIGNDNITANVNGIGFSVLDGLFYGANTSTRDGALVITSVDQSTTPATYTSRLTPPIVGLPELSYYIGDVGDGVLYLASGSSDNGAKVYTVDVNPESSTYLTKVDTIEIFNGANGQRYNRTDFVYNPNDSIIYALDNDGDLHSLDLETGESNRLGIDVVPDEVTVDDKLKNVVYGAQYVGSKNYIYASENNSGNIYRVHIYDHTGGLFSYGPVSSSNDGAKCPTDDVCYDFGDAPAPYGTLLSLDNSLLGARHELIDYNIFSQMSPLSLGIKVEHEDDGVPSLDALGDDGNTTVDDEDGVVFSSSIVEEGPDFSVEVTVRDDDGVDPTLYIWVDWNRDSTFSAAELIKKQKYSAGNHTIAIGIPEDVEGGYTYARFRLSTDTALLATGPATDGEVEDYRFYLVPVNDAPIAAPDSFETVEDVDGSINVLLNDTDIDGVLNLATVDLDTLTAGVQTTVTTVNGVWTVVDSVLTYSPKLNFNGVDSIFYSVKDDSSAVSNVVRVLVTVLAQNDEPKSKKDSIIVETDEDVSFSLTATTFDTLFTDVDAQDTLHSVEFLDLGDLIGGQLYLAGQLMANNDLVAVADLGNITFVPYPDWNGPALGVVNHFHFRLFDGELYAEATRFDVVVLPVNDAPVVGNIGAEIYYNEGDGEELISTSAQVSDIDDTQLDSVMVRVVSGYSAVEDTVLYSSINGIVAQWYEARQTLVLSGGATPEEYREAIRTISYWNRNTNNPAAVDRVLDVWVNDGEANSDTVRLVIHIVSTDDDVEWSIHDKSVIEGDAGTTDIVFTIKLSEAVLSDQTVNYYVDLHDVESGDITSASNVLMTSPITVTVPAGKDSVDITLQVEGDEIVEIDPEIFYVHLTAPSAGQLYSGRFDNEYGDYAKGRIINDDTAYLSIEDGVIGEGTVATVAITLSNAVEGGFSLIYQTADSTALVAEDYQEARRTLHFDGNQGEERLTVVSTLQDSIVEGDEILKINLETPFALLPESSALVFADSTGFLTIIDNDTADIIVAPLNGYFTSEDEDTARFSVVLTSKPYGNVTVNSTSQNRGEGVILNSASLLFTPDNWFEAQILTVVGQDDLPQIADGTRDYDITMSAVASNTGADATYNQWTDTLGLQNLDNDDAGLIISVLDNMTSEGGDTAAVSVKLRTVPTSTNDTVRVIFTLGNTIEGTPKGLADTILVFDASTYNEAQSFVITGLDDAIDDGDISYFATARTVSDDGDYDNIQYSTVIVNEDNDTAGVIIVATDFSTSEDGDSTTISAVLESEPTDTVLVGLVPSNTGEGQVRLPNPVVFTPDNWNVIQYFKVDGVDENIVDGDANYVLVPLTKSDDLKYNSIEPAMIPMVNLDNDTAGYIITPDSLTIAEDSTKYFTLVLTSKPADNVDFTLAQGGEYAALDMFAFTFEPEEWDVPIRFAVKGLETYGLERQDTVVLSISSVDALYNDLSQDSVWVTITPVNDAPTSSDTLLTIGEDTVLVFTENHFYFNDIDNDSFDSLRIVTLPTKGTLWLDKNNNTTFDSGEEILNADTAILKADIDNLRFSAVANENGVAYTTFDFKVNDGTVDSDLPYVVYIDVTPVNDKPTAENVYVSILEDHSYNFIFSDFSYNDIDGQAMDSLFVMSLPTNGTLWIDTLSNILPATGKPIVLGQGVRRFQIGLIHFTPDADEVGAPYAQFLFQVSDGESRSEAFDTVFITVTPVDDMPLTNDTTIVIDEDMLYDFTNVSFPYSDVDLGDTLTAISFHTMPAKGLLWLDYDGDSLFSMGEELTLSSAIDIDTLADYLVYLPDSNEFGVNYSSFKFSVHDTSGISLISTFSFDVTSIDDVPTAENTYQTILEDDYYLFSISDFDYNDNDGDAMDTLIVKTLPNNGFLWYNSSGTLNFTPSEIIITPEFSVPADQIGSLYYIPATNESGVDYAQFTYTVVGGDVESLVSDTAFITVLPVNDPPTSLSDSVTVAEDSTYRFELADFAYNDIENDPFDSLRIVNSTSIDTLWFDANDNGDLEDIEVFTAPFTFAASDISKLYYKPLSHQFGVPFTRFDYQVSDSMDFSIDIYEMMINVIAVNDAPSSIDNTIIMDEDSTYDFAGGEFVFLDVDNDAFVEVIIEAVPDSGLFWLDANDNGLYEANEAVVAQQTISVDALDSLYFMPLENENGLPLYAEIPFRVSDGVLNSDSLTYIYFGVTPINDTPLSANDTIVINEDSLHRFQSSDFTFNDVDDEALVAISITSLSDTGLFWYDANFDSIYTDDEQLSSTPLIILNSNITHLHFTPHPNDNGLAYAEFEFNVYDGEAYSLTHRMQLDILPVNDAPTAADSTLQIAEDSTYRFTGNEFTYSDFENEPLDSLIIDTIPAQGNLWLDANNDGVQDASELLTNPQNIAASDLVHLYFTPVANEFGLPVYTQFAFYVNDSTDNSDSLYYISFGVSPVNDAPVAKRDANSITEDTDSILALAQDSLLFNDSDIDGDSIYVFKMNTDSIATTDVAMTYGTINWSEDGSYTYHLDSASTDSLAEGEIVMDSIPYIVSDSVLTDTAYLVITITGVNDAPVAINDIISTNEDTAVIIAVVDRNDTDVDGTIISIDTTGVQGAMYGTVTIDGDSLTYTPDADFDQSDSLQYIVEDDGGLKDTAWVIITVNPINDAPTAADSTLQIAEDSTYQFTGNEFTYSDVENEPLDSLIVTTIPAQGNLWLDANNDGVQDANELLTNPQNIAASDLVHLYFTPVANASGLPVYAEFEFYVNDGTDNSDSSYTISFGVSPVNDAPTAADSTLQIAEDSTYQFTGNEFTYSDVENEPLDSLIMTTIPAQGNLWLDTNNDGVQDASELLTNPQNIAASDLVHLYFTPVANESGLPVYAEFEFYVNDGTDNSDSLYTISFGVSPVNDAPTAADSILQIAEDETYQFTGNEFTYSDVENEPLDSLIMTTIPAQGNLWLDTNNDGVQDASELLTNPQNIVASALVHLYFTPVANESGLPVYAEFEFYVNDGTDNSDSLYTISFGVSPVNDAPTAADSTLQIAEDSTYQFTGNEFTYSDVENEPLDSLIMTTIPAQGNLWLDTNNDGVQDASELLTNPQNIAASDLVHLYFTPVANESGLPVYAEFEFYVNDGTDNSDSSYTISFGVSPVNDAPTAADSTLQIAEDSTYQFTGNEFTYSDVENEPLDSLIMTTIPAQGNLWLDTNNDGVQDASELLTNPQSITASDLVHLYFTPVANESGLPVYAEFEFYVNDGTDNSDSSYTISFGVSPVNDAPTAADSTLQIAEDSTYQFTGNEFTYSDVENEPLDSLIMTTIPAQGNLWLDTNNDGVQDASELLTNPQNIAASDLVHLYFTPVANASGLPVYAEFEFYVNDGTDNSDSLYTISFGVSPVNDAPTAADSTLQIAEDSTYQFTGNEFTYSDVENEPLDSLIMTTIPAQGNLWFDANNDGVQDASELLTNPQNIAASDLVHLYFTPVANESGLPVYAEFEFYVNDGTDNSDSLYTISFGVSPVNDAPTSDDLQLTLPDSVAYQFSSDDFVFDDADGDTLHSILIVDVPENGTLWYDADGDGVYDVGEELSPGTVISKDDIDKLHFTPDEGSQSYTFEFQVSDGTEYSDSYQVVLDGEETNQLPEVSDIVFDMNQGDTLFFDAADFIDVYYDGNDDALVSIMIVSLPDDGTLYYQGVAVGTAGLIIPVGNIDELYYLPVDRYWNGEVYFDWSASDGTGFAEVSAELTIVVAEQAVQHFVPEIFTPNDDGANDLFTLPWLGVYSQVKVQIFNRWGSLVYSDDNYKNDWRGYANVNVTLGDGALPVGTYFYVIEIVDIRENLSGYVYLNR